MISEKKPSEQRLVRGVIYDSDIVSQVQSKIIVDEAKNVAKEFRSFSREIGYRNTKVSDHQLYAYAYGVIDSIVHPNEYTSSLIIPSNMIDEGLYNQLKPVDISEKILKYYKEETHKELKEQGVKIKEDKKDTKNSDQYFDVEDIVSIVMDIIEDGK